MTITIISIASVVLALVTAGCIAYVAWDLTSEDKLSDVTDDDEPAESN